MIAIVRTKFIAVLLGPSGIGLLGLFTETVSLISGITNLGLGTSAVKDIAAANIAGQKTRVDDIVAVFRRLIWITGTLGAVVILLLAPWLSELTFDNRNYTLSFIWLSAAVLFNQLSAGHLAILQGMRKLKYLAKANLAGSLTGLLVSVPLYYKWGADAIVPAIIITSLMSLASAWYFLGKLNLRLQKIAWKDTLTKGKDMFFMGVMISLVSLTALGSSYILRIFISNTGGIEQLGLYNAGFAIINSYVGLIFTAMGTDYYPRLSAVGHSNGLCSKTINQQAEITLLILAPILTIFLVFIQWIILLLYSAKFAGIYEMIYWAAIGMFFKATSWAIAFIMLAKSASRLFFLSELVASVYMLILNILGYKLFGITGLGISFLLGYGVYLIQVYAIARLKYSFTFSKPFYRVAVLQFLLTISCFMTIRWVEKPYSYFIGMVFIAVSVIYSFAELDKRIGIKSLIADLVRKK